MQHPEAIAVRELPSLLAGWLGTTRAAVAAEYSKANGGGDLIVRGPGLHIVAEVKGRDDLPTLERAAAALRAHRPPRGATPIIVVPHAGPTARAWLADRGLSWLDLSGNADIRAPGLRILVEGKPNRFARAGRPSTVFSAKAARVTRWMLVDPDRWWTQRELTEATRLSAGFVSKLVRRMVADELLEHREPGGFRPRSPPLLLDAWAQAYRFTEHQLLRYQFAARTGPTTLRALAGTLGALEIQWAATGLAAAWELTHFVDFRITTIYLRQPPSDPEALGLHAVPRGENVWLLIPRDDGVFDGGVTANAVPCVSPAQAYLDLGAHPERSKEAAEKLRSALLTWRRP